MLKSVIQAERSLEHRSKCPDLLLQLFRTALCILLQQGQTFSIMTCFLL